ncbi:hypothetical protein D3C83_70580 [compost metagenome]
MSTVRRAAASVPGRANREGAAFYLAVFENGLSNRVTAGENRGTTLSHDYVVREWWGPIAFDGPGELAVERSFSAHRLARGGVAAFVQSRRSGDVLQALALPGCA